MRKRILASIGIFFIIIIVALVGLFFLSQTQYFRNLVRSTAESIVSSTTGQTFTIGELEGNFFNNIKLSDVSFVIEGENFVTVKEIALDYSLPHMLNSSTLFSKVVPVDDLLINGLEVNLIKYTDGTWNFEKIGEAEEEKENVEIHVVNDVVDDEEEPLPVRVLRDEIEKQEFREKLAKEEK